MTRVPSRSTFGKKFTRVLIAAGVKTPKKATHWARATFATWCSHMPNVLSREALKAYLGHENVYGGATDDYVQTMIQLMPAAHRELMTALPSPTEVMAMVERFVPVQQPASE
jgi:hypothetical protein